MIGHFFNLLILLATHQQRAAIMGKKGKGVLLVACCLLKLDSCEHPTFKYKYPLIARVRLDLRYIRRFVSVSVSRCRCRLACARLVFCSLSFESAFFVLALALALANQ